MFLQGEILLFLDLLILLLLLLPLGLLFFVVGSSNLDIFLPQLEGSLDVLQKHSQPDVVLEDLFFRDFFD